MDKELGGRGKVTGDFGCISRTVSPVQKFWDLFLNKNNIVINCNKSNIETVSPLQKFLDYLSNIETFFSCAKWRNI